jgi:hypothetical protein
MKANGKAGPARSRVPGQALAAKRFLQPQLGQARQRRADLIRTVAARFGEPGLREQEQEALFRGNQMATVLYEVTICQITNLLLLRSASR